MTLGEQLKALRTAHGWTQKELAQRARVRQALISDLEQGKIADTKTRSMQRLAEALGVTLDALIGPYPGPPDPEDSPGEVHSLDGSTSPPGPSSYPDKVHQYSAARS
jgi:transcriptional regulator with XRE-family HTH domain